MMGVLHRRDVWDNVNSITSIKQAMERWGVKLHRNGKHSITVNDITYEPGYIGLNYEKLDLRRKWITDNCVSDVYETFNDRFVRTYYFRDLSDAMLFKLRWHDNG